MIKAVWLAVTDPRWSELLARSGAHDVYHTAAYHAVAQAQGEGEARLFACMDDERFIALPLLVRDVPALPGAPGGDRDASSIYGYAGPITSAAPPDAALIAGFQASLRAMAAENRVVAVFARLHPLLEQATILQGLGEIRGHGSTVSIDLQRPTQELLALYSSNHRRNLEKLRKTGFTCRLDSTVAGLDRFIAVYHENMRRVGASDYYLFERDYFLTLRERLGDRLQLLLCEQDRVLAGGALFMVEGGIVQYHLGAVASDFLRLAPLKLLLDEGRAIFAERGCGVLHLGGGRGGAEDSLFQFKTGFSNRRHPFTTWRWVVDHRRYADLAAARGIEPTSSFFPAYRA
jgi:hypothetical protein